jgi:hypothetical protein
MTPAQIFVLIIGAAMIVAGLALFARKGTRGKNTIKMFGAEFQLAGSSLVVVVLGGLMVLQAAGLLSRNEDPPDERKKDPAEKAAVVAPPARAATTFTPHFRFPLEEIKANVFEADAAGGMQPNAREWLTLAAIEFGATAQARQAFRVTYRFSNPTNRPITFDPAERYFSLTDDRGRVAPRAEFDPPAQGTVGAHEERTLVVVFDTTGWHGKQDAARTIYAAVNGLLPVRRASWEFRPPVAAPH